MEIAFQMNKAEPFVPLCSTYQSEHAVLFWNNPKLQDILAENKEHQDFEDSNNTYNKAVFLK